MKNNDISRCNNKEEAIRIITEGGMVSSDLSSCPIGYMSYVEQTDLKNYINPDTDSDGGYTCGDPYFLFLSEELRKDSDVIRCLLKFGHLEYSPDVVKEAGLMDEWDSAVEVAGASACLFRELKPEFRENEDFVAEAVARNPELASYLDDTMRDSKKVCLSALEHWGIVINESLPNTERSRKAKLAYLTGKSIDDVPSDKEYAQLLILNNILSDWRMDRAYKIIPADYISPSIAKAMMYRAEDSWYKVCELFEKLPDEFKTDELIESACRALGNEALRLVPYLPDDKISKILWPLQSSYTSHQFNGNGITDDIIKRFKTDKKLFKDFKSILASCGYIIHGENYEDEEFERAISKNASMFCNLPKKKQADDTWLIKAMRYDDMAKNRLYDEYAERHQDDEIFMHHYMWHLNSACYIPSPKIKTKELMLYAIKHKFAVDLSNASEELKNDKDIAKALIEAGEYFIANIKHMGSAVHDDDEIMSSVIALRSGMICYASPRLQIKAFQKDDPNMYDDLKEIKNADSKTQFAYVMDKLMHLGKIGLHKDSNGDFVTDVLSYLEEWRVTGDMGPYWMDSVIKHYGPIFYEHYQPYTWSYEINDPDIDTKKAVLNRINSVKDPDISPTMRDKDNDIHVIMRVAIDGCDTPISLEGWLTDRFCEGSPSYKNEFEIALAKFMTA